MQKKAFGAFEIKEVNEEKRTFKGIASTPSLDRANDVMVSKGAQFTLPMPLLFHHDPTQPIGLVTAASVTDKGIEVEFTIPAIAEEGALKARIDEAYQSLLYGLVKGMSVGFIPEWENVEYTPDGGIQFNEWEWYELSLVTIPCNRDAETDFSKAYEEYKAALSKQPQKTVPDDDTSGKKHIVVKLDRPTQGGVKL